MKVSNARFTSRRASGPPTQTVDAAAPAEVLVVLAFGIEMARVGEPDRVAVGGAVEQDDRRAFGMTVPPTSMSPVALRVGKN